MTSLFSIVIPVLNEEKNIHALLETIFKQLYRPIEVILVDGGSTDRTAEVIATDTSKWNCQEFRIILVDEQAEGYRSLPHARNLGISRSHGSYILLIDADFVLIDAHILNQLALALGECATARFRTEMMKDTWLEYNLALDSEGRIFRREIGGLPGTAFRREALTALRFDNSLGVGEDIDFLEKMKKAGISPPVGISAMGARHRPHTLTELEHERRWYGRTALLWLKKCSPRRTLTEYMRGVPVILFAITLAALFLYGRVGLLALAAFFSIPFVAFLRSSERSAGRFIYLAFVRYVYSSFFFCYGVVEGVIERIVKGRVDASRGV